MVSLELRYGTCEDLFASACRTSPRALRDLLMWFASFIRSPSARESLVRSDPAKSHRCRKPTGTPLRLRTTARDRIRCDRLLRAFSCVLPTARLARAVASRSCASSSLATVWQHKPGTETQPNIETDPGASGIPSADCLTSISSFGLPPRRSRTASLYTSTTDIAILQSGGHVHSSCSSARRCTPGCSVVPSIVKVLPEPVCP
mmetsp:Transcript_32364/g.77703  ORF Transcript_32364/g.77703 Transcript_32364/m.77703 type:complete len:203 (-) Transcript_32364:1360-1968(-)